MIDAHLHFWEADHAIHDWPQDVAPALRRGFTPNDIEPQLTRAGVESVVLMQSRNDFAESLHFGELARRHRFIGALVGWIDLTDPDGLEAAIGMLAGCGKLRGIRHLINFEPDPNWLYREEVQHSIGQLAALDLILDLVPTDESRFAAVLETARRHDRLSVVIDHMARPPVRRDPGRWREQISQAAQLPNVSIKLSVGLDVLRGWTWSIADIEPFARTVIEAFGPGRVMAASNWPVALTSAPSYGDVWRDISHLLGWLDPQSRAAVLDGTARDLFSIFGGSHGTL